jgi:hypothetical protein
MTEAQWLVYEHPIPLLEHVEYKASKRKLRLFACACCRRIQHLMDSAVLRTTLEAAEDYADGQLDEAARKLAYDTAFQRYGQDWYDVPAAVIGSIAADYEFHLAEIARSAAEAAACTDLRWGYRGENAPQLSAERAAQSRLVRCLWGNPFRPSAVNSSWLTSTASEIAQGIYDDRAFDRLPILSDALEAAGCDNTEILGHCRSGGEHSRGCWVVDAVLCESSGRPRRRNG